MVQEAAHLTIVEQFSSLEDPRDIKAKKHQLLSIIVLAVAGVICGAESWVEIEEFGKTKETFFRDWLPLENGIPSHDTFGRVFAMLDAKAFQEHFVAWVKQLVTANAGNVVAIDGKTVRRSHDKAIGKDAINMVSAWAQDNRLVLGQVKTEEKSNEITAIPELLRLLLLDGCIVTIDAMGCQKEIINTIVERKADYAIAVKENQKTLYESIKDSFAEAIPDDVAHESYETIEKGHGRIEKRTYSIITEESYLDYVNPRHAWTKLNGIGMVKAERTIKGVKSQEQRYYITSIQRAKVFAHAVRNHWGIENSLHWVLDTSFHEDQCRIRSGYADQNFAVLRHIALNLIRQHQGKGSVKTKRLKSGWDDQFLLAVLTSGGI